MITFSTDFQKGKVFNMDVSFSYVELILIYPYCTVFNSAFYEKINKHKNI